MRIIRNYFFWAYERGSFHYDIMVTAILVFIFVGPHYIDFKDKPVTNVPLRASEVLVKSHNVTADGNIVFTYEIRAEDLATATTDDERRDQMLRIIEPIAGEVTFLRSKPVSDTKGKIIAYDATVRR